MTLPKAYEPCNGQMYQILLWDSYNREYDHLDYAKDSAEKKNLLDEYRLAYGAGFRFKTIKLPQKYWKNSKPTMTTVYHGSKAHFEKFDYSKMGLNGTAEGYGFYFTDKKINCRRICGKWFLVYRRIQRTKIIIIS